MYFGDAIGAILILLLCGMILPIVVVLLAAAFDLVLVGWAALTYVHDHLVPRAAH